MKTYAIVISSEVTNKIHTGFSWWGFLFPMFWCMHNFLIAQMFIYVFVLLLVGIATKIQYIVGFSLLLTVHFIYGKYGYRWRNKAFVNTSNDVLVLSTEFSLWAFFLSGFWAMCNGQVLAFIILFSSLTATSMFGGIVSSYLSYLILIASSFIFGCYGNKWIVKRLKKIGYRIFSIKAKNKDDALFFYLNQKSKQDI